MTMRVRLLVLLLLIVLLLPLPGLAAQAGLPLVNTAHIGEVTDLSGTAAGRGLASVGQDEVLRVWSLPSGQLEHAIQVGPGTPVGVRISNAGDRAVVIVRRAVSDYRVLIYALPEEEIIQTIDLNAGPTFFGVSRRDSLLILALPGFDSLRAYRMSDGERARTEGFAGAITGVLTASNEQTFMTYRAGTGALVYRDRLTGEVLAEAQTLAFLNDLQPLPGRRVGIARLGEDLVGVDLLDGGLEFRATVPGLQQHVVDDHSGRVATLSRLRNRNRIQIWDGAPGPDNPAIADSGDLDPVYVHVAVSGTAVYAGLRDGSISVVDAETAIPRPLAVNRIAPIQGIDRNEGRLLLAAGSQVISLAPQLAQDSQARRLDSLEFGILPLEIAEATGIRALPGNDLVVWSGGDLRLLNLDQSEPDLRLVTGSDVRAVASNGSQLVVTTERGTLASFSRGALLDLRRNPPEPPALPALPRAVPTPPETTEENSTREELPLSDISEPPPAREPLLPAAQPEFTYAALGLQTAIPLVDGDILVGASRDRVLGTGLLRINPRTSETVPVNHPGDVILALAQLSQSGSVFSIDSREIGGQRQTVLSELIGLEDRRSADRIRRLAAVNGDWSMARLAMDPEERVLYASMGDGSLLRRDLRRGSEMEVSIVAPVAMEVFAELLLTVEPDGGLQLLSAEDLSVIGKLYAFRDGNWVLISEGGYLASSPEVVGRLVTSGSSGQQPAAGERLQFPLVY